jgi:hypothetical protein
MLSWQALKSPAHAVEGSDMALWPFTSTGLGMCNRGLGLSGRRGHLDCSEGAKQYRCSNRQVGICTRKVVQENGRKTVCETLAKIPASRLGKDGTDHQNYRDGPVNKTIER